MFRKITPEDIRLIALILKPVSSPKLFQALLSGGAEVCEIGKEALATLTCSSSEMKKGEESWTSYTFSGICHYGNTSRNVTIYSYSESFNTTLFASPAEIKRCKELASASSADLA